MLTSTTPGMRSMRPGIWASLTTGLLLAEEVVEGLAAADQPGPAVGDEHRGRPRDGIVVGAHRERVGARGGNGPQGAPVRLRAPPPPPHPPAPPPGASAAGAPPAGGLSS